MWCSFELDTEASKCWKITSVLSYWLANPELLAPLVIIKLQIVLAQCFSFLLHLRIIWGVFKINGHTSSAAGQLENSFSEWDIEIGNFKSPLVIIIMARFGNKSNSEPSVNCCYEIVLRVELCPRKIHMLKS